jgi:hypothetical protein
MSRLIYIFTGLVVILADSGAFRSESNFFAGYRVIDSSTFVNLVKYLLFGLTVVCVVLNQISLPKYGCAKVTKTFVSISLVLLVGMSFLSAYASKSLSKAFSTEIRHLAMISIGSLLIARRYGANENPSQLILFGIAIGYPLRWIYGFVQYFRGEGVSIGEVTSSVFDPGPLTASSFLSFILLDKLIEGKVSIFSFRTLRFIIGFASCFALIAVSFRRSPLMSFGVAALGGVTVYFYTQRVLVDGIKAATAVVVFGLFGFGFLTAMFGIETATRRLESISVTSSGGYAHSNQYYIDDWYVSLELTEENFPLGSGFGVEYGSMSRLFQASLVEAGVDPVLHSGFGELAVRTGIMGLMFWAILLLVLPAYCIWRFFRFGSGAEPSLFCFCVFVLFMGLFPFQPPPYSDIKNSLFITLALSLVLSKVADLDFQESQFVSQRAKN